MKEIIITIDKEGATKVEGRGFRGRECDRAMKPIEDALGVVGSREDKPEIHAAELPATAKVGQR